MTKVHRLRLTRRQHVAGRIRERWSHAPVTPRPEMAIGAAPRERPTLRSPGDVSLHALAFAPGSDGAYELRAGEELVAVLTLTPGTRSLTAEVETAEGWWILVCQGLVFPKVVVLGAATPGGSAHREVRRDWRHAWTVTGADSRTLRWRFAGPASPDWVCTDEGARVLIDLVESPGPEGAAQWQPGCARAWLAGAAQHLPELSLVLVIGWFLFLKYQLEGSLGGEG